MRPWVESMVNITRSDFKDHQARWVLEPPAAATVLRWSKPNTSIMGIEYIIRGRFLFACWDLGDAVYEWSENISLSFLAGCDLQYFEGKCQASEVGRTFKTWYAEKAVAALEEFNNPSDYDERTVKAYLENRDEMLRAAALEEEWKEYLEHGMPNGTAREIIFGCDWYEYFDIGSDTHGRCIAHWLGLRMAYEQLMKPAQGDGEVACGT